MYHYINGPNYGFVEGCGTDDVTDDVGIRLIRAYFGLTGSAASTRARPRERRQAALTQRAARGREECRRAMPTLLRRGGAGGSAAFPSLSTSSRGKDGVAPSAARDERRQCRRGEAGIFADFVFCVVSTFCVCSKKNWRCFGVKVLRYVNCWF